MFRTARAPTLGLAFGVCLFAATPAPAQRRYELSFRFEPGQQIQHRYYVVGKTTDTAGTVNIQAQFRVVREAAGTDPARGMFLLKERVEDFRGTEFDARGFGLPAADETIERQVDGQGRVANVVRYTKGHRYYLPLLVLPANPIKVGEVWKFTGNLVFSPQGQTVQAPCGMAYVLESVGPYKGRTCAKIRLRGTYSAASESGAATVSGTLEGVIYFDLGRAMLLDLKVTEGQTQRIPSENWAKTVELEITALLE